MIYKRTTKKKGQSKKKGEPRYVYHYDLKIPQVYAEMYGLKIELQGKPVGRIRRSSGSHLLEEAREIQRKAQKKVDQMLPLDDQPQPVDEKYGLDALLQGYRTAKAGAGFNMDRNEDSEAHLLRHLGNPSAQAVKTEDVERFVSFRLEEGAKPATVQTEIRFLRAGYNWGILHNRVTQNPTKGVVVKGGTDPRERLITEEEFDRLFRALDGTTIRDHVEVALYAGLRLGELQTRREKDLDFHSEAIWIAKSKTGEARSVTMHARVKEILWQRVEGIEDRQPFKSPRNIGRPFRRALKRAGLSDIRWNDLRHAFAGRLLMSGADIRTVMQVGGWKDPRTPLRIYARVTPEHIKEAVQRLSIPGTNSAQNRHIEGKNHARDEASR